MMLGVMLFPSYFVLAGLNSKTKFLPTEHTLSPVRICTGASVAGLRLYRVTCAAGLSCRA